MWIGVVRCRSCPLRPRQSVRMHARKETEIRLFEPHRRPGMCVCLRARCLPLSSAFQVEATHVQYDTKLSFALGAGYPARQRACGAAVPPYSTVRYEQQESHHAGRPPENLSAPRSALRSAPPRDETGRDTPLLVRSSEEEQERTRDADGGPGFAIGTC